MRQNFGTLGGINSQTLINNIGLYLTSEMSSILLIKGGDKMAQGYCVKCKSKRDMANEKPVTMKNGRKAVKGKCPTCGTGMYRIQGK